MGARIVLLAADGIASWANGRTVGYSTGTAVAGFLPADIALIGVRHQRQPIAARLAANFHADGRSVIARRDGRLTISIGTAVDGVLDHSVDGGVVWATPSRLAILAPHRQIEIVLVELDQSLPGATEFQDFSIRPKAGHSMMQCGRSIHPAKAQQAS
jgi:hypothetical protein